MSDQLWPESVRGPMAQLSSLVLYRTPTGWRYAIYADSVMDGRLTEIEPDEVEAVAQEALIRFIEAGTERRFAPSGPSRSRTGGPRRPNWSRPAGSVNSKLRGL